MTAPIKPFGIDPADFERVRAAALRAWEKYGDDDEITCKRIREDGMWNDHIAVQAAVEAYKEFVKS